MIPQNPIFPIEMLDLTIGPFVFSMAAEQKPYFPEASMTREYDVFEKFPDGSSLWRVSVAGLGNARLQLHELTRRSDNQFYAIDITGGKTLQLKHERDILGFRTQRKTRTRSTAEIA
jgi:hypothetical protein